MFRFYSIPNENRRHTTHTSSFSLSLSLLLSHTWSSEYTHDTTMNDSPITHDVKKTKNLLEIQKINIHSAREYERHTKLPSRITR